MLENGHLQFAKTEQFSLTWSCGSRQRRTTSSGWKFRLINSAVKGLITIIWHCKTYAALWYFLKGWLIDVPADTLWVMGYEIHSGANVFFSKWGRWATYFSGTQYSSRNLTNANKKYIENKHLIKKNITLPPPPLHVSSGILFRTAYFMSWTIFIPIEYCYATMWAHEFLLGVRLQRLTALSPYLHADPDNSHPPPPRPVKPAIISSPSSTHMKRTQC